MAPRTALFFIVLVHGTAVACTGGGTLFGFNRDRAVPETRVAEPPIAMAARASVIDPQAPTLEPPVPVSRSAGVAARGMAAALRDPAEGLSDIFFDIDSASLPDRSRQVVEANARLLKATQGWRVHIEGHCDERGSDAYNIVLGERRAQAVRQALADLGIPVNQVHVVSYGEERPLCEAHEESCWHKNRRAHFVVDIPAP